MLARLRSLWVRAQSSYWFIPSSMMGSAVLAAVGLVELDRRSTGGGFLEWLYEGGIEGARAVLQVVAGSTITVAGVVFSVTIVALSSASQQNGPRLLARFMRDTGNQVVLGTFVSTYVYCLLVLRNVRASDDGTVFVPQIAVAVAIALALAGVVVLIYFIHHTAASIRVDNLVARIGRELAHEAERAFEDPGHPTVGQPRPPERKGLPEGFEESGFVVAATESGYVDDIDVAGLVEYARERGAILWLRQRRGSFVGRHSELARLYPETAGGDDAVEQVNKHVYLGRQRSGREDVVLLIGQLVEMASRALSPGINDPFTAMACIDQLGDALARVADRGGPSVYHYEGEELRLVTDVVSFETHVDLAFDQIRRFSRTQPTVMIRILQVIALVGSTAESPERRAHLMEHARMIRRQAAEAVPEVRDRREIEECFESVRRALAEGE